MHTFLNKQVDRISIKKLERYNLFACVFTLALSIGSFLWLFYRIGGPSGSRDFSNSMYALTSFIGTAWSIQVAFRGSKGVLRLERRYVLAWLLVALSLFFNGLGGAVYGYQEDRGQIPFPSLADLFFLLYYPLFFTGLLLIPLPKRFHIRMGIDALITTCCLLGFIWYFIIGPQYVQQTAQAHTLPQVVEFVLGFSYPAFDVFTLMALFLFIYRCVEPTFYIPSILLVIAQLSTLWANLAYAYFTAFGMYQSGNAFIDSFWFNGPLLVGLAGLTHYTALLRQAHRQQAEQPEEAHSTPLASPLPPTSWRGVRSMLIYLPFLLLLLLCAYGELYNKNIVSDSLLLLTMLLSIAIAARFILATHENERLLLERDQQRQDYARLYNEMKEAHKKLKELDQLKDQFMITTSHELRTPLTAVQGYIELLATFGEDLTAEQQREFLQKARMSCEELVVLLTNIMDASRMEMEAGLRPIHVSRVAIRELIENILLIIEPQLTQHKHTIELNIPATLGIYADPVRLRQVLMNIGTNALKYSEPCTPLSFSTRIEERHVILSISDKGKGITPEEQSHVFERFYRVESDINSPVRGSGLGLYISQRLIEAMGGKIWIESQGIPGEGSTFHIQLPLAP